MIRRSPHPQRRVCESSAHASRRILAAVAIAGLVALASGCANGPRASVEYFEMLAANEPLEVQLAGEALTQKKIAMRRMHSDMMHFHATMAGLQRHRNRQGAELFEEFERSFIRERLGSLLREGRETWHPELRPLEANLVLAEAALWVQLGDARELGRAIDKLSRDFRSMKSMLVEYPFGEDATLAQSIASLRQQRRKL